MRDVLVFQYAELLYIRSRLRPHAYGRWAAIGLELASLLLFNVAAIYMGPSTVADSDHSDHSDHSAEGIWLLAVFIQWANRRRASILLVAFPTVVVGITCYRWILLYVCYAIMLKILAAVNQSLFYFRRKTGYHPQLPQGFIACSQDDKRLDDCIQSMRRQIQEL